MRSYARRHVPADVGDAHVDASKLDVDFRTDAPQGPPVEFRFAPDQVTAELG